MNQIDENIEKTVDEYLTENPVEVDLTGYATEKYVDDAITAIDIPEVDLSDYYTKTEVDDLLANLPTGNLPSGEEVKF